MSWSKLNNPRSSKDKASLTDPSDILVINFKASSDTLPFSLSLIFLIKLNNSDPLILDKSNLWHLETIVIGTFLISVVAKINFKYSDGSSKVFSKEFHAV